MRIIKILLIILVVLAVIIVSFLAYMGAFKKIEVTKGEFGPHEIIYSTYKGPYTNLGKAWGDFQKQWQAAGLKQCDSLALYLDPPDTPPDKTRSVLACKTKGISNDQLIKLKKQFKSFMIPRANSIQSTFPYKNMLSFMLGPVKVYPEFHKVLEAEKLNPSVAIEVYGEDGKFENIQFIMPYSLERTAFKRLMDSF